MHLPYMVCSSAMSDIPVLNGRQTKPAFGSRGWQKNLLRNDMLQRVASSVVYHVLRLSHLSQRQMKQPVDPWSQVQPYSPAIIALWHGQHLMVPFMWPKGTPLDALISKNADAEINARVLQRMGVRTVRGSGGRDERQNLDRGGAKALLALRRSLAEGRCVAMIADVSHTERRQAGEGIIALARISGRPIIPVAYATSNYYVFEKSWDKATLNLPFGKVGFAIGEPIFVDAGDDMAARQKQVTDALNDVTRRAASQAGMKDVTLS
jgi:lysophospholipid acyltransferase (LPLAT)-like uncharacterized protein